MKLGHSLFVNRTELAEELGVSVATIRNWSKTEEFPRPLKNSGKIPIFRTAEIINWLEEGAQE
jgi:predicted DNA-binding transcriptional regulator AlpA